MSSEPLPYRRWTDLITQMQGCIDIYQTDRSGYWEDRLTSTEDWSLENQLRRDADDIATAIRKRALTLTNSDDVSERNAIYQAYLDEHEERYRKLDEVFRQHLPEEQANELLKERRSTEQPDAFEFDPSDNSDRPLQLIGERLCIEEAWEATRAIVDRVNRILELDRMINAVLGPKPPPDACAVFLALVSRCYVHGLIPECAVMCRAAMETAFREAVTDEHCEKAGQRPTRHGYTLGARIEAAFHPENELLTDHGLLRDARRVRNAGDTAAHKDPTIVTDALGLIRSALKLIDVFSKLSK